MKDELMNDVPEVLDWPTWWRGPGMHFTQGVPFVGVQAQIGRMVNEIMAKRTQYSYEKAWNSSGISEINWRPRLVAIHRAVSRYLSIPNGFFLPKDRCALALGIIPGVWYDIEDVAKDIRESGFLDDPSYYEIIQKGLMCDLIGRK